MFNIGDFSQQGDCYLYLFKDHSYYYVKLGVRVGGRGAYQLCDRKVTVRDRHRNKDRKNEGERKKVGIDRYCKINISFAPCTPARLCVF